jgi:tetratricopeptide (TPR) repeat protein
MMSNYELRMRSGEVVHSRSDQILWTGLEAYYTVHFIKKWCGAGSDRVILKYEQLLADPVAYYDALFRQFQMPREFFKPDAILEATQFSSDGKNSPDGRKPFQQREIEKSKYYDADCVGEFCRLIAPVASALGYSMPDAAKGNARCAQIQRVFEVKKHSAAHEYEIALKRLDEYLSAPDADILGSRWRGVLLAQMGRETEAEVEFEKVIKVVPGDPLTCANLAKIAERRGNLGRAKLIVESCLKAARDQRRAADQMRKSLRNTRLEEILTKYRQPSVSREDVINAFKYIFGREPESEHVIAAHQRANSLAALRSMLFRSDEFARKFRAIIAEKTPAP